MSVLQRTLRLFVLAAAAMAGQLGFAEGGYYPFSEPMDFDPDWQFFAPVQLQDLEELSVRKRANHGFYLTYDRVYTGMSRSITEAAGYSMDMTWGNRYDFGWMNNEEKGWNFSVFSVGGPNAYNQYLQSRLSMINTADTSDPTAPFLPESLANDPYYLERVYEIKDSVNVASLTSFEVNRSWRFEPYRYGGMLEPMVGMRYIGFRDTARNDLYNVAVTATDDFGTNNTHETLLNQIVQTQNDMVLGQIGFRYSRVARKTTFSTDFRAFAGHNFQTQDTSNIVTDTIYGGVPANGTDAVFDGDHRQSTFTGRKGHQTPVGFDLRTEGSYKITKYIDLRAGFQLLYIGKGVWRGSTQSEGGDQFARNQHVTMPGVTFGITMNR